MVPAAELVSLPVALIVAVGSAATTAAMRNTNTIPIVMTMVGDPVGRGLVASLAHPGGNITGVTNLSIVLYGKELELLQSAVPNLSRVAIFWDATINLPVRQDMESEAQALGLVPNFLAVKSASDFESALAIATQERAQAFLVIRNGITVSNQTALVNVIAKSRLPALYVGKDFADAGGLMAFGPNTLEIWARVAVHVDKILKGTKPADIPVELPTKFDFVINLKTVKALGLTLPQSVLAQATEVIE